MAANENLDQYLPQTRKIALFGYLTDQELQGILEHAEIVHYPEGEKIVSQDEVSEYLFAIIKGMVKVTVRDQDEDVFICNIEEGEEPCLQRRRIFKGLIECRRFKVQLQTILVPVVATGFKGVVKIGFATLLQTRTAQSQISHEQIQFLQSELRKYCPLAKLIRAAGTVINEEWRAEAGVSA